MEIRKGLEQIFKRLYFRQNEEQSWNLKFGTFCTVFSADTFDECLPAILTLIQHSLMEICWENEALTFSSSLANKTSLLSSSGQQRRLSLQLQPELKSKPSSRPRSPTGGERRKAADKQLSVGTRDRLLYFPLGAQSSTTSLLRLSSSEQKTNASKKGGHVNFSQLARMLGAGQEPLTYLLNEHILALEINLGVCRNLFEIQPLAPSHDTWWSLEKKTQQKGINAQSLKVCGK